MQCSVCETTNPDENAFCENCGVRIGEAPAAEERCGCGALFSEMDADGFCTGCGLRLKRPDSDHIEIALTLDFAGVSDRGLRHNRNEDRFAITASGEAYGLIVCDGVSMSPDSDEAASSGVAAGIQVLSEEIAQPQSDAVETLRKAIQAAASAVSGMAQGRAEAPATTLVAAIATENLLTVGWIGDSRAYWFTGKEAVQLTRDHSWQNSAAARDAGAEAQRVNAHALTRWVGSDSQDLEPEILQRALNGPGLLMLCSDGLWNYTTDASQMAELVLRANQPGASALSISRDLVNFARNQGGHDNITAVVLRRPSEKESNHAG